MLIPITKIPTAINIPLVGNLPVSLAASGAAITPPKINPIMIGHWLMPITVKKVNALATVMQNFAATDVPTA